MLSLKQRRDQAEQKQRAEIRDEMQSLSSKSVKFFTTKADDNCFGYEFTVTWDGEYQSATLTINSLHGFIYFHTREGYFTSSHYPEIVKYFENIGKLSKIDSYWENMFDAL